MAKDIFGIICAGSESEQLRTLVSRRDTASLPIGGRYRIIDFLLSNMVNSGIRNIGILTRRNCRAIMDHVGAGKEWDLDRKNGGLFIMPPNDTSDGFYNPKGMLDELKNARRNIAREEQPYCLVCNSSVIYSETFDDMLAKHKEIGADITVMYSEEYYTGMEANAGDDAFYMNMDEDGRITELLYNPVERGKANRSMECILMHKSVLQSLIETAYAHASHNLMVEVLKENLSKMKVYGYKHEGYAARINSVADYFEASMDMLKPEVLKALFYTGNNVFTKTKDEPPTSYGEDAVVENSLIASGCSIEGVVENSIIFRGVHIAKGVVVRNSIVMQKSQIYDKCELDKVILDKNVVVRPGSKLMGSESYPVVIPKGGIV